ncbi:purine efflux pump PbuE [Lentilactobacillus sunkii]|jgi:predicted MFS family arabinose efflux permease|uniref:Purine efflux pump PbuE n=1 Tax=Lentilactobacillus sunkii TaxID=481719 RepID=A0A1E7X9U3_9LACO|nr:MFS transporter [Lentilactobacillus sunkii]OFA09895.1 purine efflux pump PbuE [Lentilactobacillus sunkii]
MKTFKFQSFVLVLIAFVLGFSEFLIVGILDDLSTQFNVPVATVGYLVTAFAIVYAISTPFITILIGRFNLFWDLMATMAVFTVGNILSFLAPNFFTLALSRVITAMVAGVSISLGLTFAGYIAPMSKRGWLLSWVFSGFSIASVVGVPLGTWISTRFGWRISFLTVIVVSAATMIMIFLSLPKDFKQRKSTVSGQLALLKNHKIQLGMLLPMFNLAAIYVFYTYLRPIITTQLHFSIPMLTILLSVFGISNIIGNRASGKLSEGPGMKRMPAVFIAQFLLMMLMPFAFNFSWPGAILLTLVIFTMPLLNSPIQLFFLQIAEREYPQSIVLASSLNSIFSNFGIALGSATGGVIVSTLSLNGVGPGGAVYAIISLGLVLWLNYLTSKGLSTSSSNL